MPEQLTPELLDMRARLQRFIDDDLRPLQQRADDGEDEREIAQQVITRSRELGFFGLTQPAEFGGSDAGPLERTVARETLAAANLEVTRRVLGPGPGVLASATGSLRERYLEPLMRGEQRGAFAFTEPPEAQRPTHARIDGEELVVDGRKAYVSGGSAADFYQVMITVEENGSGPAGAAMVIVERGTPGLSLSDDFITLDGGTHCSLIFEGVRIPLDSVVGAIGEGLPRALGNIGEERLQIGAQACGTMMWVVEFILEQVQKPHRTGTPLGEHEQVRSTIGQMMLETYVARSALYRTARLAETGEEMINEGAISKVFAAEAAGRVIDHAIQLTGGQSLIEGHPLERLYRMQRSWRLGGGSTDILRIGIARGVMEFDTGRV